MYGYVFRIGHPNILWLVTSIPIQLWQVEGIHHFLTKPYRNEPRGFPMGYLFEGFLDDLMDNNRICESDDTSIIHGNFFLGEILCMVSAIKLVGFVQVYSEI